MTENPINFSEIQKTHWRNYYVLLNGYFYFAQGAMVAMMALLPLFMQERFGMDPADALGLQGLINIPWYIKIVWGFLSDNVTFKKHGRRRPYIIGAGILGIVAAVLVPSFTSLSAIFILAGIFLSLSIAFSDAVIDSLSVDVTPTEKRFLMQGVGWGGRGLGAAISASISAIIAANISWQIAFLIPGSILASACILAIFIKEPQYTDPSRVFAFDKQEYKMEFKKSTTWIITLYMLFAGTGITILSVFSTFLAQPEVANMDLESVGLGLTLLSIGQFIGAVPTGIFGNKFSLFKAMLITTVAYIVMIALLGFFPIDITNLLPLYIIIVMLGAVNGSYEATQMRVGMEYSVSKIGGSMYNWYMSISNIGQIALGAILIGNVSESIGYRSGIQISSIFLALALLVGYFAVKGLRRSKKQAD